MATGAAYLRIRRQKARRLLEAEVEGIETDQREDSEGFDVVDAETDEWLATVESCQEASEPDVDLPFTPQTRVEYRTDATGTATRKLRQVKDRLIGAASKWRW